MTISDDAIETFLANLTDEQEAAMLTLLLNDMKEATLLAVLQRDVPAEIRDELIATWDEDVDDDDDNILIDDDDEDEEDEESEG